MELNLIKKHLTLLIFVLFAWQINAQDTTDSSVYQPPIPVEIMVGNNSSMYEMVVVKQIMNSKFKFLNFLNYEVDYDEITPNSYYIQTIVSYDLPKGFGVGIGSNLQTYNPIKPLVAVSYAYYTAQTGFFIQPSYEIHKEAAFEI